MTGLAFPCADLPETFVARQRALFVCRWYARGQGDAEYRFNYHDRFPCLPLWHEGQLLLARWGNGTGLSAHLPHSGWTWSESLAEKWAHVDTTAVVIPARLGFAGGVWYPIFEGVQGLLVTDEKGPPVVFVLVQPASHYYQVMTRCSWMPLLVNQVI